jgi:hypothetical protein
MRLPAADEATGSFRVFGGVLQSDCPLPGLPVAPFADDGQFPFWRLVTRTTDVAPSHTPEASVTGRLAYSSGPVVTLADRGPTPEIVVSDTGRFTIDAEARTIGHLAPVGVDRAAVALDLIGVVLPYAMHRDGAWCMHASAVQTPGGAVAFVATRGTGKSTLAAACVQAGCALVADDVVVLRERAGAVTVAPSGVPLRLRADTARGVGLRADDADGWGKVRVAASTVDAVLPLAAVYLLSAASPADTVARAERSTRAAALALLTNGKVTELLGGIAAGEALGRCVTLAGLAPVYDLAVPRDLARLPDVVQALLTWHTAARPTPVPE